VGSVIETGIPEPTTGTCAEVGACVGGKGGNPPPDGTLGFRRIYADRPDAAERTMALASPLCQRLLANTRTGIDGYRVLDGR